MEYLLEDDQSGLFAVDREGRLTLGRRPIESEQNRFHVLNVTARNEAGEASTRVCYVLL